MIKEKPIKQFAAEVSHELGFGGKINPQVQEEVNKRLVEMSQSIKALSAMTWDELLHFIERMPPDKLDDPVFLRRATGQNIYISGIFELDGEYTLKEN